MRRYLLVHGDSAAGNLIASKTTVHGVDKIQALADLDLGTGLIPSTLDLDAFARERKRLAWSPEKDVEDAPHRTYEDCLVEAATFDEVELWFGPRPGSQLALAQMITVIANRADVLAKTILVPLADDLGVTSHTVTAARTFEKIPLNTRLIAAGASAWAAWSSPAPRLWRALLDEPSALPYLAPVIPRLLAELPDPATGLTHTQMRLLNLAALGKLRFSDIIADWHALSPDPAFTYWPLGQLFLDMFHGPAPLLTGTQEERFGLALHEDEQRHQACFAARVSVTPHGKNVLAGAVDHASVAPIDYHWGGTHITRDNLWRWNADTKTLIAP